MDPATRWWMENTAQGRRLQRRILPESALGPRARRDAREEREENDQRSFLTKKEGTMTRDEQRALMAIQALPAKLDAVTAAVVRLAEAVEFAADKAAPSGDVDAPFTDEEIRLMDSGQLTEEDVIVARRGQ